MGEFYQIIKERIYHLYIFYTDTYKCLYACYVESLI